MANESECLGCGQKFKQKDCSLQCTVCGLWAHKTCSGVTNDFFKCLSEQFKATGRAYWACRSCHAYAEGMSHRLKQLEKKTEDAIKMGEANAKEIENLKDDLHRREAATEKRIQTGEEAVLDEINDRERRRKNIVLYGVKESEQADGRMRMEDDKREINNIFTVMDVNLSAEDDVEFCRRVGPRGETPRPLVCGFYTEWSKNTMLKFSKRLEGTARSDVSVAPDLTKQQRKAEAELEQEAGKRNEELTNDDKAKNLEWQVVGKKGQRRLVKAVKRGDQPRGRGMRGMRGPERGRMAESRKRQREDNERERNQPAKRGTRGRGRPPLTGSNRARLGIRLLGDPPEASQDNLTQRMDEEERREEEEEEDGETENVEEMRTSDESETEEGLRLGQ